MITLLSLACLAPALSACGVDADPAEFESAAESPSESDLRSSSALTDAVCGDAHQVAVVNGGSCPAVNDWETHKLFDGAPGVLNRYCVYDYTGDPNNVDLGPLSAATLAHSPDCGAVFPEADPMANALAGPLQDAFYTAINRPTELDLDLANTNGIRTPVTVAVIDTVPDASVVDPNSPHGVSMTDYIADIACPGGGVCPVAIDNHLGMPRIEGRELDLVHGGLYGSHADLAAALWEAVSTAPPNQRVIFNLSLGWEGQYFGAEFGDSVAINALYAVIQRARCDGHLIIAAAGNQGHLCTDGPLLPAAWEEDPSPGPGRCSALGSSPMPASNGYKPLVYAIGGLDYEGAPLPNARTGGMPRLAATGLHAVPNEFAPTTALSGSSISAAVVSGAAGLIWSYYPQLRADQVMDIIYTSGEDLGFNADFVSSNAPSSTEVHRVDVCAAVEAARQHPATNPFAAPLGCLLPSPPPDLAALFPIVNVLKDSSISPKFDEEAVACSTGCSEGLGYAVAGGDSPCPVDIEPALPFTTPQPDLPACPSCTIDPGVAQLHASLDPRYAGLTVTDVLVTLWDGYTPTYLGLGPVALTSTGTTQINLDAALIPVNVDSATISISFADDRMARPNISELIVP